MRRCWFGALGLALTVVPSQAWAADAALSETKLDAGLDVIAGYAFRLIEDALTPAGGRETTWYHAFSLPRAQGILDAASGRARARLLVEAAQSTEDGSLFGVAGDSVVLRLREARVGYDPVDALSFDLGMVPTFAIATLDQAFVYREVGASVLEASGLASAADLGATARYTFPCGYGFIGVGAYNGEGYTARELNRGKNLEAAAGIHPFPRGALAPLTLVAAGRLGSEGVALSRADRLTGALLWDAPRIGGGVALTYGFGAEGDGQRRPLAAELTARGEPLPDLLLTLRGSVVELDRTAADPLRTLRLDAGVGYRLATPLTVFLVATRSSPTEAALAASPGSRYGELSALTRFRF